MVPSSSGVIELGPDVVLAGKLRLLRPLGQGGMGVVWAARHLTLGTEVAVKLIRPERVTTGSALVPRFEREARATARIAHPHVVKVMDFGTVPDGASTVPFLVMELLQGFTLAELIERGGRLSFATARSLVEQLGSALEAAHEAGVVHRDIKPQNVFIIQGSKGVPLLVKVLDFGVAKMADDEGPSTVLTQTGVVIGSAPYMSPEQLEGRRDVDLRSDLWSFAVIVYEALTGRQPFGGSSFVTVGAAVLRGQYRPASELRPNLPPSIDDWFAKALCLDPEGRFASARAMIDAFPAQGSLTETDMPASSPEALALATTETAQVALQHDITAEQMVAITAPSPAPLAAPSPRITPDLGGTASHAPLAEKPAPRGWKRLAFPAGVAATLALTAGIAASGRVRPGGQARCPGGMVLIEGATFSMGSPAEGETPSDETPLHTVTVPSFCLDTTEVTVEAYTKCTSCNKPPMTVQIEGLTPNALSFWGRYCNRPDAASHPINCVDWHDAAAYCAAQNKRLPTEAEWELAARGTERATYPWGHAPPSAARLNACGAECQKALTEELRKMDKDPWPGMHPGDDGAPFTSPVGRYPEGATPRGVLDLAGNVWEWTDSHYCPYPQDDCDDSRRVLRGGGWDTVDSQFVRAAHRRPSAPSARGWSIGFRCAEKL
ncbi:MAG: bifunctional serine/threonine-protein kinase/formylglycine-generating enzyme family protein [Byssovorax sp.]